MEFLVTLALSDKSSHLCDSYHSKSIPIESYLGLQCLNSSDHCQSWSFQLSNMECHSKSHEYPRSLLFYTVDLVTSSSNDLSYEFRFPFANSSCCWNNFDVTQTPVELISFMNISQVNSPPMTRLPYQIIGYLNDEDKTGQCLKTPSITLLNIENDLIYTFFNESIHIDLISQSQCDIEMNECSMISAFQWKVKSIVETTIEDQIQIQFE
ncbi:unnamed protein product [Adineta ricciae]|uniref:Uncharacterized protein n=1 Tax=Adineta ricciae TaxID=249248 RepID=A0A815PK35_ADIRI|nr:unnamed protein product [Adineta ricciae]CAF1457272.1 unnamed protein product [Adineta ricciae]